jgi:hypothetical protein
MLFCARAASGHTAAPPIAAVKSRRFMPVAQAQEKASYRFN